MNYELVKKLKDAGFPFDFRESKMGDDTYTFPTLSELIEACGRGFWGLRVWTDVDKNDKDIEGYQAMDNWHDEEGHCNGIGSYFEKTPEEAVAKLWLALKLNNRLDS